MSRNLGLGAHILGVMLLVSAALSAGTGCVETADCDQATPCPNTDNEVCYQFRCVTRCTKDEPVCSATNERCRACEENCPGDSGYACVLELTR